MTPVSTVTGLIKDNLDKLDGLLKEEHIYGYMIDPNEDTETEPILLVSELPRGRHGYGNDEIIFEKKRIQIQLYYPRDYEGDIEGLESNLKSFLRAHDYYCFQDAGHVMTPDNRQLTNTLKFNYIKEF